MYTPFLSSVLSLVCLTLSVLSQEITTTDALGETIVEIITVDPALGLPTTSIIETLTDPNAVLPPTPTPTPPLTPSSTTTTSTSLQLATDTTTQEQVGPVGAPPTTPVAAGPTVYTYTTTDANGNTIGVVDTFTPVYETPTTSWSPVSTGSILDYSQWLSIVGATNSALPNNQLANGSPSLKVSAQWVAFTLMGAVVGAWAVLA